MSFNPVRFNAPTAVSPALGNRMVRWIALLGLCAAYLQGGIAKALDFNLAVAEMQHFGLSPAAPVAAAVIAFELLASIAVLVGLQRWFASLGLAAFTLAATFTANRFWELAPPDRFMAANSFFEHLGLVGGFLLVAWMDIKERGGEATSETRYR